jgi:hypothetical protein
VNSSLLIKPVKPKTGCTSAFLLGVALFSGGAEGSFWLSAFVATIQAKKGISQSNGHVFAKYMI